VPRIPADSAFQLCHIAAEEITDLQAAGIVIAAIQEDALLAFALPMGEALHDCGAAVDV
jgi:hypothetical protein